MWIRKSEILAHCVGMQQNIFLHSNTMCCSHLYFCKMYLIFLYKVCPYFCIIYLRYNVPVQLYRTVQCTCLAELHGSWSKLVCPTPQGKIMCNIWTALACKLDVSCIELAVPSWLGYSYIYIVFLYF